MPRVFSGSGKDHAPADTMNHLEGYLYSLIIIIVFSLLTSVSFAAEKITLPEGWRFPTAEELTYASRKESPTKYSKAVADFNGDGINDEAFLLKSIKFSGEGLFVRLSYKQKGFRWIQLDVIDWGKEYPKVDLSMSVAIAKPGNYETACGKGYFDCKDGEPEVLKLRRPAIDYFRFESANSFFVWDEKMAKFKRIWMSD
jgi:hypothetical protein